MNEWVLLLLVLVFLLLKQYKVYVCVYMLVYCKDRPVCIYICVAYIVGTEEGFVTRDMSVCMSVCIIVNFGIENRLSKRYEEYSRPVAVCNSRSMNTLF